MKHIHKFTMRGTLHIDIWNRFIQFLTDNNIPYKTISKYSKTRDDSGLYIYYDSIIFIYDKYIPINISNTKKISITELFKIVNKQLAI